MNSELKKKKMTVGSLDTFNLLLFVLLLCVSKKSKVSFKTQN